jgi:peroxiredoxin
MVVQIGDEAPDFALPVLNGGEIRLSGLRGSTVLVSFYRYASCPLCNLRIAQLRRKYPTLRDSGLQVLSIFHSPPEAMKKFVGKHETEFPLLYDPEETVYKQYEIGSSVGGWLVGVFIKGVCCCKLFRAMAHGAFGGPPDGTATSLPADFLIDEEGIVRDVFLASSIDEHMPWNRIQDFVEKQ